MSQAVSFSFQGDVFAGGSLAFSAAGKLLKSLSDGGVDVYAVAALVELGKCIPISQHQEVIVSRAMQKRSQTRNGYLAKALSIGWGHNDAAYELSKTRGGCAALLTMNAFGAGNSAFVAAQGLQELMRLKGCEVGYLPSVDVIKNVVSFMTPIMKDSGFHSVFETIRLAAVAQLAKRLSVPDSEKVCRSLTAERNTPSEWTDACHQLSLTSKLGESILLQTSSRSVWLAAFAVVILEMECTLLYGTSVLWGAGGSKGSVTIQIADHIQTPIGFSKTFELRPQPTAVLSYEDFEDFEVTYLLEDALRSELLCLPYLSVRCQRNIKLAIVRMFTSVVSTWSNQDRRSRYDDYDLDVGSPFLDLDKAIMSVCQRLGISLPNIESEISQLIENPGAQEIALQACRDLLGEQDILEICSKCHCQAHQKTKEGVIRSMCLLDTIKDLLSGFSATALALLPCAFHTSAVRVRPCVINGRKQTRLSNFASYVLKRKMVTDDDVLPKQFLGHNLSMHLSHLRALLHGEPGVAELPYNPLAFSAKDTTVAVRALLEDEAFSVRGQYLAIYSGRLSSKGCLREIVTEGGGIAEAGRRKLTKPYTLATGCLFRPTNASSCRSLSSLCTVDVKSDVFEARFYLVPVGSDLITSTVSEEYPREDLISLRITASIYNLLRSFISSSCGHSKETPLLIPKDSEFELFEAGIDSVLPPSRASCLFLSAHGTKSQQLIAYDSESCQQFHFDRSGEVRTRIVVLQGDSCLPCAFLVAQRVAQWYERPHSDTPSKLLGHPRASIGVTVICS